MILYTIIGKNIAGYRKKQGWSQTDLAYYMNMSRGSIANIEKGRQAITFANLVILSYLFNAPIPEIIKGAESPVQLVPNDTIETIERNHPKLARKLITTILKDIFLTTNDSSK